MNVFIGLGGNVGDRLASLKRAARALSSLPGTRVAKLSPVYETSPVGPRQRPFLNAAARLSTALPPAPLLRALKRLEKFLGRKPGRRWGPRAIDLDILFYGARRLRRPGLTLPHPRLRERKFVLKPLSDIAPGFRDPVTGRTVRRLLRELTAPDQSVRLFRRTLKP